MWETQVGWYAWYGIVERPYTPKFCVRVIFDIYPLYTYGWDHLSLTCLHWRSGQGPCPSWGSDLPSLGNWSGTMPLLGKWPALPWELVRDHAPPGEVLRERVTSQVRASLSGWGHTSRGGSYLRFPREGQNAPPGAVILYTPCLNHHQQWQNCIKENEGLHLYSLYVVMVFRKHTQILSGTYLHVSMLFINK